MSSIFQIEVVVRSGVMISQVWHDCKRLRRLTGADVRFRFNGHLFVYSGQPLQALIADYHARLTGKHFKRATERQWQNS